MSIQLKIPEALETLKNLEHPLAAAMVIQALTFADTLGFLITQAIPGTSYHSESIELWDGDITIPISGIGEIPHALRGFDDEGWEP